MTKELVRALLVGALCVPELLAAQGDPVATRVQGGLDTKFAQAECKVEGGDFRVSSGKTYLKTGLEGSGDPSNRAAALKNGVRVVTEAITSAGQDKSSAAWYWLGRLYLQEGDLRGADSAFTRTVALTPGCKDEVKRFRIRAWAALVNAGGNFRKAQQGDSAFLMYRAANQIYQNAPLAYMNMADMFNTANQGDSATYYFGLAAHTTPTDTDEVRLRNQALFNYGALLLNSGKAADAVAALRSYVAAEPSDPSGKKGLAQAFRAAGMTDSAQALERQLVSQAGVSDSTGQGGALSEEDLMNIGAKQFGDKNYREAAATFGKVVAANPWNSDAVYDLANAELGLQDGPGLAKAADRLIAIEPLYEYAYTMKAQGYKFTANQDSIIQAIVTREALPVNLEIQSFAPSADSPSLTGKATGRDARDANNRPIPARPVTVVVEFLGKDAAPVATTEVTIPALKPGDSAPFTAAAKGAGAVAWRYRVK